MHFLHAGYLGGDIALPYLPVKVTVKPTGKDDTETIQATIDSVGSMPMENGLRGAVLLSPGTFTCSKTITLNKSGVVLRGSCKGLGGAKIFMTGGRHAAFNIGDNLKSGDRFRRVCSLWNKHIHGYSFKFILTQQLAC